MSLVILFFSKIFKRLICYTRKTFAPQKIKKFVDICNKITSSRINCMKGDKTVFIFCQTSANKNNTDNHSDNIDYCISMIADGGAVAETAMSEMYSLTC